MSKEFLSSVCAFYACKPLSQTLLMAIYANVAIYIPPDLLLSMWTAWQTDYAVHVTNDQKKKWEVFFQQYVPTPNSLLDRTTTTLKRDHDALNDILSSMHWDAFFLTAQIQANVPLSSARLLRTTWTETMARLIVEKVFFEDQLKLFSNRDDAKDVIRRLRAKMNDFPQVKVLEKSCIVDWFFLRTLLCTERGAGPVLWAGGSIYLLLSSKRTYTAMDVYDQFEKEGVDIDLFFAEFEDIEQWLMELQDCHFCSVILSEGKRYATIRSMTHPSIHFKANFIHISHGSTVNETFATFVIDRFDLPPCAQGIMWEHARRSFVHIQTLPCSMISDKRIYVNCMHEARSQLRVLKYIARGCPLVETDVRVTVFGAINKEIFEDYTDQDLSRLRFMSIHAMYAPSSIPEIFKTQAIAVD